MRNKILLISLVCIFSALIIATALQRSASHIPSNLVASASPQLPNPKISIAPSAVAAADHGFIKLRIGTQVLTVEVVKSNASITQGLSDRSELGADGMLFVFQQRMMPRFWMKEMQFPLDLIWIDQKQIVDITHNAPAPDPTTPLSQLPTYAPRAPVDWVLEVPASTAAQLQWKVGLPVVELSE